VTKARATESPLPLQPMTTIDEQQVTENYDENRKRKIALFKAIKVMSWRHYSMKK